MRSLEEIYNATNLKINQIGSDGGSGIIYRGTKPFATVVFSYGGGWEHISMAPLKRSKMPTWDDMCRLKDMFFYEDEVVVQYHPAKKDYVNMIQNCLHLWKPIDETLPVPPSIFVGLKKGRKLSKGDIDKIK